MDQNSRTDLILSCLFSKLPHFKRVYCKFPTDIEIFGEFTLFTNHKALVAALNKPHLNQQRLDREARQLDYLCTFVKEGKAQHIPGKENIVVDTLSRAINNICFPAKIELIEI